MQRNKKRTFEFVCVSTYYHQIPLKYIHICMQRKEAHYAAYIYYPKFPDEILMKLKKVDVFKLRAISLFFLSTAVEEVENGRAG